MENNFITALSDIFKIIQSGKLGKEQVINVSLNVQEEKCDLEKLSFILLCLGSSTFTTNVIKESLQIFDKPYRYGVVSREYDGGAIFKMFFRCAPIAQYVEVNVYGSNAELSYDSRNGKVMIYNQIPESDGIECQMGSEDGCLLCDQDFWGCLLSKDVILENKDIAKKLGTLVWGKI